MADVAQDFQSLADLEARNWIEAKSVAKKAPVVKAAKRKAAVVTGVRARRNSKLAALIKGEEGKGEREGASAEGGTPLTH